MFCRRWHSEGFSYRVVKGSYFSKGRLVFILRGRIHFKTVPEALEHPFHPSSYLSIQRNHTVTLSLGGTFVFRNVGRSHYHVVWKHKSPSRESSLLYVPYSVLQVPSEGRQRDAKHKKDSRVAPVSFLKFTNFWNRILDVVFWYTVYL